MTTSSNSSSTYLQSPSNPPALTIVLSIACGGVATCILLTIILLLFRHRSYKEPFRQGESGPTLGTSLDDKALGGGGGATQSLPEHPAAAYLPVLHSHSPLGQSDDSDRGRGLVGPVPSLAYPKAVFLGSSRNKTV